MTRMSFLELSPRLKFIFLGTDSTSFFFFSEKDLGLISAIYCANSYYEPLLFYHVLSCVIPQLYRFVCAYV